jgi:hypothetical protein
MVAAFCERLGWYDLEALIAKFQVGRGSGGGAGMVVVGQRWAEVRQ